MKQKKSTEIRQLTAGGHTFTYTLERKRVKNLNLRVRNDGSLYASAPPRVPLAAIEDFIRRHADFILQARERQQKQAEAAPKPLTLSTGEVLPIHGVNVVLLVTKGKRQGYALGEGTLTLTVRNTDDEDERRRVFARFLDAEAKTTLTAATERLFPLFLPCPDKLPVLKFRTMTSKWGICRPKAGTVTLNRNLVFVPHALADYVICHELAHFKHPDHSPAFWAHLSTVLPDCKERRKALNAFATPRI